MHANIVFLVDSSIADISKFLSFPSFLRELTSFVSVMFLTNMPDPPDALWLLLKLLTSLKPLIFKTCNWTSDSQCSVKHRIFILE